MNNDFYQKITKSDYVAIGNCMLNGSVKNDNGFYVVIDSKAYKAWLAYKASKRKFNLYDFV